jgi:hypothetical protein
MSRRSIAFAALAVFVSFMAAVSCGGSGGKRASLVSSIREKAEKATEQAKAQVVKTAVQAFTLENGRPPESLRELVEKGYMEAEGIVDSQGNERPYSPQGYTEDVVISKSCGACGKPVSSASQVGDRCPHCGVVWGA